ncbi:SanA/YdcF family protein [Vibrio sp. WXL103]|uniref:SanA/YdcF family protein n=1 Tax=unclassified Vibrio TaxID=2614977 RepID=UPI003EC67585
MFGTVLKAINTTLLLIALAFALVIGIDAWITEKNKAFIYHDLEQVPEFDVGLILGTSKYLGRTLNLYYQYRMDSTYALLDTGKIKHILVSGDNAHRSYNEPWTMKRDLLKHGVSEDFIHLDYAGFRTLDSVIRAQKIFGTNRVLIITQQFHCERALFIANNIGMDAACFAAQTPGELPSFRLRVRELLARVKAVLDLFIFNTEPKFLGPQEPIQPGTVESTYPFSPQPAQVEQAKLP